MERLILISMSLVIVLSVALGIRAVKDLNDGRVQLVVKQLMTPQIQAANAESKPITRQK